MHTVNLPNKLDDRSVIIRWSFGDRLRIAWWLFGGCPVIIVRQCLVGSEWFHIRALPLFVLSTLLEEWNLIKLITGNDLFGVERFFCLRIELLQRGEFRAFQLRLIQSQRSLYYSVLTRTDRKSGKLNLLNLLGTVHYAIRNAEFERRRIFCWFVNTIIANPFLIVRLPVLFARNRLASLKFGVRSSDTMPILVCTKGAFTERFLD